MQQGPAGLRCAICGRPYEPGQEIRAVVTEKGPGIVHRECQILREQMSPDPAPISDEEQEPDPRSQAMARSGS